MWKIGRGYKKKVVILLQPRQVDGWVITPNLFFFHGPNSSKSAKKFFSPAYRRTLETGVSVSDE